MRYLISFIFLILMNIALVPLHASEVIEETHTKVIVREHPKTGKPYVSIVSRDQPEPKDPFANQRQRYRPPDYRMLDPKLKSGAIPYEGPYSDRKKVYVFAASLATVGTAGGLGIIATAPAATGAAAGGSGAYFAGAGAVAAGTTTAAIAASKPKNEEYLHRSESKKIDPRY